MHLWHGPVQQRGDDVIARSRDRHGRHARLRHHCRLPAAVNVTHSSWCSCSCCWCCWWSSSSSFIYSLTYFIPLDNSTVQSKRRSWRVRVVFSNTLEGFHLSQSAPFLHRCELDYLPMLYSWLRSVAFRTFLKTFISTRNVGHSPTWGHPALYVRGTPRGQVWWSYSHWPQSYSLKYAEFCPKLWILAFPQNYLGGTQIFERDIKLHLVYIIWQFRGDRPRGLRDFALKPFTPIFEGRLPNLRPPKSKCPHFQSYVKVSRRSAEAPRRYNAAKWKK